MTITVNDACRERVQISRERTGNGGFPLPDPLSCVRYALTEGAETDDEFLRAERSGDVRNNDRQRDARKEWGQTGYMILSAVIQLEGVVLLDRHIDNTDPLWNYGATMGCLADYVVECATDHTLAKMGHSLVWAWLHWRRCAKGRGWDAVELIEETCAEFEKKHAGV